MTRSRDVMAFMRACQVAGCRVAKTRRGHYRVQTPSGALVFVAGSPTDHRGLANARALLRRHGVNI